MAEASNRQSTLESISAYENLMERVNRERERSSNAISPEVETLVDELEQLYARHVQSDTNAAPIVADKDRQVFTRTLNLLSKRMQNQVNASLTALTAKSFSDRVRDAWAGSQVRTDAETRRAIGRQLFHVGSFIAPLPTIRGAFTVERPTTSRKRRRVAREDGENDTAENVSHEELGVSEDIIKTYALIKRTVEDDYHGNDGKAVNLYLLVLNPDSYSQTVENLFHVSHLVNDRSLSIVKGPTGLPLVAPASAAETSSANETLSVANTSIVNASIANVTPEETPDVSSIGSEQVPRQGPRQQFVVHMTYELFDKLRVALVEDLTDEDGVVRPYLPSRRERDAFDREARRTVQS